MNCSIGFGGVESCKTIPDCLHGIVKENKKLADENNVLKENNIELQKNIGKLQDKFNVIEKQLHDVNSQSQWVDVPLDDTKPFDEDCDYRAKIAPHKGGMGWVRSTMSGEGSYHASVVTRDTLFFIVPIELSSDGGGPYTHYANIHYDNKNNIPRFHNAPVYKIEKRCAAK